MNGLTEILKDEPVIAPSNVKMTEPVLLSECGPVLVVDGTAGEQYQIEIEPGEFLVVKAGATMDKRSHRFDHPNVAAKAKVIHEFKHHRRNGGKFWTARAGMDFYLVIPRSAVKLLPEKGYSYIPAEINGVKVRFNVSGGTKNGWTDWLRTCTTISVNHPLRDLNKLAEVAVLNSGLTITPKPLEADQEVAWKRAAARVAKGLVEKVVGLLAEGKKPIVKLMPGYQDSEGVLVDVTRRSVKVPVPPKPGYDSAYRIEYTGAVKRLILGIDGHWVKVSVKMHQVDWAATAAANGVAA